MSIDQPGLRIRLEKEMRRIASQHVQLSALFEELRVAIADGARMGGAPTAFERYRDALLAHFSMEDQVAFPAFHGLAPELGARIEALAREHRELGAEIEGLGRCIATREDGAMARLLQLGRTLREHETREEALVALVRAAG